MPASALPFTRQDTLDVVSAVPTGLFFDPLSVRLGGKRAEGAATLINFGSDDLGETQVFELENAVLRHRQAELRPDADTTVKLGREGWAQIITGRASFQAKILGGESDVDGSRLRLLEWLAMLDDFAPTFNTVTPRKDNAQVVTIWWRADSKARLGALDQSRRYSPTMQRVLLCALLASLCLATVASTDAHAVACPVFQAGVSVGTVSDPKVVEASGLAASRQNPGVLWLHNDRGNAAELFAIGEDGRALATYLPTGITNRDWEDLAIGPGPTAGVDYLFIGDIGDNAAARKSITVYRIPEPVVSGGGAIPLAGGVALEMVYPDGAHDAEVLLSDSRTGDLYIVTKSRADGSSGIYRYPFPHVAGSKVALEHVATHTFPGKIIERAATGGDIAADGSAVIVRTYTRAYLWARAPGSTVAAAFAVPPCEIALVAEPQGEALAFAADLSGYYTLSEGRSQPLYFFRRVPAMPSAPSLSTRGPLALLSAFCAAAFWASRGR